LYLDLTAETAAEMDAKLDVVKRTIRAVEGAGSRFEPPIEVDTLVHAIPQLSMFSEFPMDLEFLTQPPGAGLTWVGTYGPMSRVTEAARAVEAIMIRHDTPPLIVSRAMRGGHFVVLRMITTFDKSDPADVERVKSLNQSLLDEVTHRGFVMYKSPVWAWHRMAPQIDPGMRRLMGELKVLLDPAAIFNPGKLGL
jgi:FAD/FMN-containing dehydrogenase